jgi:hypothetical protein
VGTTPGNLMTTRRERDVRKRKFGSRAARAAALVAAAALAGGAGVASTPAGASPHARTTTEVRAHAASALTSTELDLTTNNWYTCVGPCASATYFSDYAVARSGVTTFGWSGTGTGTGEQGNCLVSTINDALTVQGGPDNGDAIYFSTKDDLYCPTSNPNVSKETATYTISGGTGAFKNATGEGSSTFTVLTTPQVGWGTLTASVSY